MTFLTSGKVKDIYDLGDNRLLFRFSDRISAFDVLFNDVIPKKGEILCKLSEFWFKNITISNHFIKLKSKKEMIVKKLTMLPMECIVRGYFYGSIVDRSKNNKIKILHDITKLATKFKKPIFDPALKARYDIPINKYDAIKKHIVTNSQFNWLSKTSIDIYSQMAKIVDSVGFILADLKLEFGLLNNHIILGDSIGLDEYRLWNKDTYEIGKLQDSYDKQILRDWLIYKGYKKQFDLSKHNSTSLVIPKLPTLLIKKISNRYISTYEKITNSIF